MPALGARGYSQMNRMEVIDMAFKCACGNTEHYAKGMCQKCYDQRPERKAYQQRPELKAYQKAYNRRPEVKARHKAYDKSYRDRRDFLAKEREYQKLLCLYYDKKGGIPRRQILRLEALSEYLGRDLEEWRVGKDKARHAEMMEG